MSPAFAATDDEATILDLERQLSVASAKGDIATLDRIMADGYISIEAVGKVETKAEGMGEIKSGNWVTEAEEPTQMKVRLYGNVAIVTGHLSVRDKRNGKPGHHEIVFTDVWVKKRGRWQVVNYQGTLMPSQSADD